MCRIIPFFLLLLLGACAGMAPEDAPLRLSPASFAGLPDWDEDNHVQALSAFRRSCERILNKPAESVFGPDDIGGFYSDWQPICLAIPGEDVGRTEARLYFERYFVPWQAKGGAASRGLFTGYYEASLNGSKRRHGPYQYPLLKRPDDLVMVDLGAFRDELKGQRIAGRVVGAHLKPFEDRAAIDNGALKETNNLALVWVDDPVDVFFLHIQGSGQIRLAEGGVLRVGYDGQNGHPYYAIGRELVHRGHLDKKEVSLQTIRTWLVKNPAEAEEIMNTNKSYVFFRQLKESGPLGGEGVVLTPERSLAVDRTRIPYGVPLWVDIEAPLEGEKPIRKLMMAQDTGGAIRGPIRGDVYWGAGDRAEHLAGHMKSKGRYWLLLPKALKPGT